MRYFFYGFGTITFVCLLLAAIPFALGLMLVGAASSPHTLKVLQEAQSPDARNVATVYLDMGGGAAGWCETEVNIRPTGNELPPNEAIFAAHCGTKVNLTWNSSSELSLEFSPDDIDFGVVHFSRSRDGHIRIHYVEGPPQPKPTSSDQPASANVTNNNK